MSQTDHAFHQVKAILGKLDRKVDEARTRRLGDPEPDEAEATEAPPPAPPSPPMRDPNGPNAGVLPSRSEFGRAKPLRMNGAPATPATPPVPTPTPPNGTSGLDQTIG